MVWLETTGITNRILLLVHLRWHHFCLEKWRVWKSLLEGLSQNNSAGNDDVVLYIHTETHHDLYVLQANINLYHSGLIFSGQVLFFYGGLCCGHTKCLHHNISHCSAGAVQSHVGQTDPRFNFIVNCWPFEASSYHMVALEIVYLIPVILSLDPPVLHLPSALCEIGGEQRKYELSL